MKTFSNHRDRKNTHFRLSTFFVTLYALMRYAKTIQYFPDLAFQLVTLNELDDW